MTLLNASSRQFQFSVQTRRSFLTTSASGLGAAALGSLLSDDGLVSAAEQVADRD